MVGVKRALISVSNKHGIVEFAKGLNALGIEIISTGGTARALSEAGVAVTEVSSVTGFPEMLEGRVKTIHPIIAGGVLADRRKKEHMKQLEEHGIQPIDMVVINLYPFAETIAKPDVTLEEAIENIDIGGPSLIRAAAKNFESVAVVVEPERYGEILGELKANKGSLSRETRFDLARSAFKHTADYDETIYGYLVGLSEEERFPELLKLVFAKISGLRYGENPHQNAAFYRQEGAPHTALVNVRQLHGKELSYNNILDVDSAWNLASEFDEPVCVIVKHNNPCGVAVAADQATAYRLAFDADPASAFGGVIAFNKEVDKATAQQAAEVFVEAIVAPGFSHEALEALTGKKGIRLLDMGGATKRSAFGLDLRRVDGGLLAQDFDVIKEEREGMSVMGEIAPTETQWNDLLFAWKVAKHVKSNAIVLAKDLVTVGIGAGQMSRVDSAYIAIKKAGDRTKDCVMASDAFFPFRDSVDLGADAGVKAIIEPGGSVKDDEIIAACKDYRIALVFTGKRHFRH